VNRFFKYSLITLFGLTLLHSPTLYAQEDYPEEANVEGQGSAEIRRGITMGSRDGKSRSQRYLESRLKKIEPDLLGDPDRLQTYVHFFERELMNDTNMFLFDMDVSYDENTRTFKVDGMVEYPQTKETFETMLLVLGFEKVESNIEVLPEDGNIGDNILGVVTTSNTLVYNSAVEPRETLTDGVMGDVFFLLKEIDGHYLAHAPEGYICYIDKNSVSPMTPDEYLKKYNTVKFLVQRPFAHEDMIIPPGATLRVNDVDGQTLTVASPDGTEMEVDQDFGKVIHPSPAKSAIEAVDTAREFLGSDYVWGGKTVSGVDCSGLVQASYRAHGVNLPRDTYMQAYVGRLSATRYSRDLLKPGDLLFFIGSVGKINHTAIYVGNDQYIEASGDVHYTSFNPEHENYSASKARRFCFAKRLYN